MWHLWYSFLTLLLVFFNSSVSANQIHYNKALLTAKDPKIQALLSQARTSLKPEVIAIARKVYLCAKQKNLGINPVFTLIDYQLPSTKKRLWIIDLENYKVLYNGLAAHGQGSGDLHANKFSNVADSHRSSIGLYLTQDTYIGNNGYSMRLEGLEPHFNDNAMSRYIVLHGAPYVSENFIKRYGRLGRSWGCPVISQGMVKTIINKIKGQSLLLAYYPDKRWLGESAFVNCNLDSSSKAKL